MLYHIAFNPAYNTGSVYPTGHPEEHIADFTLAIPERKLWRFSSLSLEDQLPLLAESVEEAVRRFFYYKGDIDAKFEVDDNVS